jgi:phosphotriesterase-related protein
VSVSTIRRATSALVATLFVGCAWSVPAAAADRVGKIQTVLGLIEPEALGVTLMHEHLFIEFTLPLDEPQRWQLAGRQLPRTAAELAIWNTPVTMDRLQFLHAHVWENRDLLSVQDVATTLAEVTAFKEAGGGAIVDVTSIGLGRDPAKLVEVARRSGIPIVMGAGWYRSAWHPAGHADRDVASLTDEIVRDVTVGVGDSGVRAGIIGEVSAIEVVTDPHDSAEVKGVRAAARASRLTGAAITLHQWVRDGVALARTLDIIEQEGGDLTRVVVGHIDAVSAANIPQLVAIAKRGVTLEFDLFGTPYTLSDPRLDARPMADAIVALVKAGYAERLLMSHDVCTKIQQKAYGGKGFGYLLTQVVPYLQQRGVSAAQVRTIMVENPRRVLAFSPVP